MCIDSKPESLESIGIGYELVGCQVFSWSIGCVDSIG